MELSLVEEVGDLFKAMEAWVKADSVPTIQGVAFPLHLDHFLVGQDINTGQVIDFVHQALEKTSSST